MLQLFNGLIHLRLQHEFIGLNDFSRGRQRFVQLFFCQWTGIDIAGRLHQQLSVTDCLPQNKSRRLLTIEPCNGMRQTFLYF